MALAPTPAVAEQGLIKEKEEDSNKASTNFTVKDAKDVVMPVKRKKSWYDRLFDYQGWDVRELISYKKSINRPRPSQIADNDGVYGDPIHRPNFLSKEVSDMCFKRLAAEVPWFDKPGWNSWYKLQFKGFLYSRKTKKDESYYIPILEELLTIIETKFNTNVVNVWCNKYDTGKAHQAWHQDQFGYDCYTLSFGSSRTFQMRNKATKKVFFDIRLSHGDLYFFSNAADTVNQHCVPIENTKETRISILFLTDYPNSRKDGWYWDRKKCKLLKSKK